MQFVFPNCGAFFGGHYAIPWIPYMNRRLGRLWVRLWGRSPTYVDTLQLTNCFRTRRWLRGQSDNRVVTYGEEVFRERMLGLKIKTWAGLGTVKRWLEAAHRLRVIRPLTWLLLRLRCFDPIILSLVKRPAEDLPPLPDNCPIYEVRWTDWMDMKVYGPSSRWLRALLGDHLRKIPGIAQPVHVLDVGCGEGTTTAFLAGKFKSAEVVGIDRSEMGILMRQRPLPEVAPQLYLPRGDRSVSRQLVSPGHLPRGVGARGGLARRDEGACADELTLPPRLISDGPHEAVRAQRRAPAQFAPWTV
jgi:hypothetical protein